MRYLVLLFLLSSCGASFHLRQAERHLKKAEMKGANINPDTVFQDRVVYLPALDTGKKVTPALDSGAFKSVITKYDSLVKVSAILLHPEELITAEKEINRLRSRMIKGFSKDSTYNVPIDSITEVHIVIKSGLLDSVGVKRKPTVIKDKVPVAINRKIDADRWPWWYLLIAVLAGVGIGVLIMVFKK